MKAGAQYGIGDAPVNQKLSQTAIVLLDNLATLSRLAVRLESQGLDQL